MKTAGRAVILPKYLQVAASIRRQIADGTLRPGQPAPSGAELSRDFAFSTLTCRKALRALIADGLLVPGPSRNARPRVADPHAPDLDRTVADAARALSVGLAARRHAAGLTQAELAKLARVSVTTVGHAETGRTWQSRRFWERADTALRAGGDLLRLHDAYRAASSPRQARRSTADSIERTLPCARRVHAPALVAGPPAGLPPVSPAPPAASQADPAHTGTSPSGAPFVDAFPSGAPRTGPLETGAAAPSCVGLSRAGATMAGAARVSRSQADASGPVDLRVGQARSDPVCPLPPSGAQVGLSCIVIVWTDGTVTTVHAPEAGPGRPDMTLPDPER